MTERPLPAEEAVAHFTRLRHLLVPAGWMAAALVVAVAGWRTGYSGLAWLAATVLPPAASSGGCVTASRGCDARPGSAIWRQLRGCSGRGSRAAACG